MGNRIHSICIIWSAFICGLLGTIPLVQAQEKLVQGIVYDAETKQRISRVFVYNPRNDEGGYNNTKGEFEVRANAGDVIIAAAEGYHPDTLLVANNTLLIFQLHRSSIRLKEISIVMRKSPENELKDIKEAFKSAYTKGNRGSLFSVGPSGAGLSIDALYKLISREGKNARRLQEIIERDYRESVIDYRFTRELVRRATGLDGESLEDFMFQYRPSYFFILACTDYELVAYINQQYLLYKQNPAARRLPIGVLRPPSNLNP